MVCSSLFPQRATQMSVVLLGTKGLCHQDVSVVKSTRKTQTHKERSRKVVADPAPTLKKSVHRIPEKGPRKLRLKRWRPEEDNGYEETQANPGHRGQGQFTKDKMAGHGKFSQLLWKAGGLFLM